MISNCNKKHKFLKRYQPLLLWLKQLWCGAALWIKINNKSTEIKKVLLNDLSRHLFWNFYALLTWILFTYAKPSMVFTSFPEFVLQCKIFRRNKKHQIIMKMFLAKKNIAFIAMVQFITCFFVSWKSIHEWLIKHSLSPL